MTAEPLDQDQPRKGEHAMPARYALKYCQSCGAAITWVASAKGAHVPLSIASIRTDSIGNRFALSHFADCPHAKGWSKKSKPAQPEQESLL